MFKKCRSSHLEVMKSIKVSNEDKLQRHFVIAFCISCSFDNKAHKATLAESFVLINKRIKLLQMLYYGLCEIWTNKSPFHWAVQITTLTTRRTRGGQPGWRSRSSLASR